jgi:tetratricopeptide (TPR) repeat protein
VSEPPVAPPQQKFTVPQAFRTAAALHRQGRLDEAERVYRAILHIDADHVDALHYLGVACHQRGRAAEAEALLRRAIALGSRSAEVRNDLGIALAAQARHDEAIVEYRTAIAAKPSFHQAINNLGTALSAAGRPEEAAAAFEQALSLNPQSAEVHDNLGIALTNLQRPEEAVACFEKAVSLRPNYADAHHRLAHALATINRRDDAVVHFQTALALKPEAAEWYSDLGNVLAVLDRQVEAIAQYQKALALQPNAAETFNNLASALAGLERHRESVAAYRRALALKPDFFQAHCNIGRSLAVIDEHEEAIEHYRQALAIKPGLETAYSGIGSSFAALGRMDEALAAYDAAFAINPAAPDLHHSLGYALETLGRLEEARQAFAKAVALAPHRADLYRGLAESKRFAPDDPHLAAMEELAGRMSSLGAEEQMGLHFALASAYDDLGRHEMAFPHLLQGNALKRHRLSYDEAAALGMFERIAAVFTPELMRRHRGAGADSSVPVFILGMPRSGTTLVEQMLASHPDVFGAGERKDFSLAMAGAFGGDDDSPAFPERFAVLAADAFRQIGARYLERVTKLAPAAARITDKMPANFRFVGPIHLALPNARIVHVRRDPVDTCLSCFSKLFAGRLPYTYELGELGRYYRAYERLMAHWRRVLPDGAMLEVQYEEMVADFEPQARRIVAHCGLAWDDRCLKFHETRRPVRTASATQVRQPLYRTAVGRARAYGTMLAPLLEALGHDPEKWFGDHAPGGGEGAAQ